MPTWRGGWLAALCLTYALGSGASASAAVPVLVVDGQGFGHGVGMAQDGDYWMGRAGATRSQILEHFYPGVGTGRGAGEVRVEVLVDDNADLVLAFPQGGEIRSPRDGSQQPGFPVTVAPGGTVRVRHDTLYRIDGAGPVRAASTGPAQVLPLPTPDEQTTTTSPGPPPTSLPSDPSAPDPPKDAPPPSTPSPTTSSPPAGQSSPTSVWAVPAKGATVEVPDRSARYRGAIEATAGSGPLRLVDQVDIEQYLRGMGEVRDPSWPAASLQAQAVVARTYALRAMRAAGELCDTQRCQVYLGQQAEYGAMDKAVAATAGQVLTYNGTYAATVYSANGAGQSATPSEGFGTPDAAYPYLRAAPYETHTPDPWQVRIALSDLAARIGYRGTLDDLKIATTGPSGRPTAITLLGDAGPRTVPALELAARLGLRSTKWTTHIEVGDAPPPPPEAERIQALPDLVTPEPGPTRSEQARPAEQHATSKPSDGPGVLVEAAVLVVVAAAGTSGVIFWRRRRSAGATST